MPLSSGARGRAATASEIHDEYDDRRRVDAPRSCNERCRTMPARRRRSRPSIVSARAAGLSGATRFALRPLAARPTSCSCCSPPTIRSCGSWSCPMRTSRCRLRRLDLDGACDGARRQAGGRRRAAGGDQRPGAGHRRPARQRLYVNLRAPVVLDTVRRTAVQHVLASPAYPVRHCLAAAASRMSPDVRADHAGVGSGPDRQRRRRFDQPGRQSERAIAAADPVAPVANRGRRPNTPAAAGSARRAARAYLGPGMRTHGAGACARQG